MAISGTPLPIRLIPALALAAAVVACQPGAPTTQQPAAGVPAVPDIFDGLGPGERVNFQCNEIALGAAPAGDGDAVRLSYSGQRLELPLTEAATGTRYADGQGNELLIRDGDTAALMLAGEPRRDCVRGDRPSPWDRAADNGVTYRAVGQEPGWLVEVTEGDERRYWLRSMPRGTFTRNVRLPASVATDDIKANVSNGVLRLHMPKVAEAKVRRIEVAGG